MVAAVHFHQRAHRVGDAVVQPAHRLAVQGEVADARGHAAQAQQRDEQRGLVGGVGVVLLQHFARRVQPHLERLAERDALDEAVEREHLGVLALRELRERLRAQAQLGVVQVEQRRVARPMLGRVEVDDAIWCSC